MSETGDPMSFDEEIDRRLVPALKVHPMVLGDGPEDLFAAGVADMDFKAAPAIIEALRKRLDHGVFGYETVPEDLMPALTDWLYARHNWRTEEGGFCEGVDEDGWRKYCGRVWAQREWWGEAAKNQRALIDPGIVVEAFLSSPSQRNAP